ncbi:hypothetical protein C1T17_16325 [Sphingobium sp. SCG-1]|nr:hypothetical protein C1T17_16325 [Sphingobium sp. SCG-1]
MKEFTSGAVRRNNKQPVMNCPTCGAKANVRSSDEVHPTLRRIYYACTNFHCGMTFRASLIFESTISPSALGDHFREPVVRDAKPPGRDFGQMNIFDITDQARTATG